VTEPGTTIAGRYELGERLDSGGGAELWAARDLRLKRDVAVRLLSPDAESRRRFEAEARTAANLSHPNVALIYDSGEHEGRPYLVTERLPGRTLADAIADGPLSLEHAVHVARDVLAGLGAAHGAGFVHGGVTPAGVLLAGDGSAKVAGFGAGAGASGTAAGDLYAVGALLYECLTGRSPGGAALAALRPELPDRLIAAVERALDEDLSRRFVSAAEMAEALVVPAPPAAAAPTAELQVASGTQPLDLPTHEPTWRGTGRQPLVLGAVAVVAVLLVVTWIAGSGDSDGGSRTTVAPQPLPAGTEVIPAGHYRTSTLRPGVQFMLGGGWSVAGAEADDLLALRRREADGPELSFLAVGRVFKAAGRYATSADYVAADSAEPVPQALVDWLGRHPRLRASEPARATFGGAAATRIDVEPVEGYASQVCAGPCVLLFALAAERPNYRVVKLEQGRRMRLYVIGNGDRTLVISIVAPIDGFERAIGDAESVVKSVGLMS
jgi:hypothetical protein